MADTYNNSIRMVSFAGVVTTLAGSGYTGNADGTGSAATFSHPAGVAVDAAGNVYVADPDSNVIRKVSPAGVVTTIAGSSKAGSANGTGSAAGFNQPMSLTADVAGNLYVADAGNNMIRNVRPSGVVSTRAGSITAGNADGTGTAAGFNYPSGVAVDATGNVYVADRNNDMIRKVSPAVMVTTLAGSVNAGSTDGAGSAASFNWPEGVALDAAGNVYVADRANNKIRKIGRAHV